MIVKALRLPVTENEIWSYVDAAMNMDVTDPLCPTKYLAVYAANGITVGWKAKIARLVTKLSPTGSKRAKSPVSRNELLNPPSFGLGSNQ